MKATWQEESEALGGVFISPTPHYEVENNSMFDLL